MSKLTCRRVIEAMHLTLEVPVVVLMDRRSFDQLRVDVQKHLTLFVTESDTQSINGVPLVVTEVLGCWFVYPNPGGEPKLKRILP